MVAALTGAPAVLVAIAGFALLVAIDAYRWHRRHQARARGQTSAVREWALRTPTAPLIIGVVLGVLSYPRLSTGPHSNHELAVVSGVVFGVVTAGVIGLGQYRHHRSDRGDS